MHSAEELHLEICSSFSSLQYLSFYYVYSGQVDSGKYYRRYCWDRSIRSLGTDSREGGMFFVLSTIFKTDWSQAMHAGVVRDMEQQRIKRERQADFEMQRKLEEEYKKVQTVHDSTDGG